MVGFPKSGHNFHVLMHKIILLHSYICKLIVNHSKNNTQYQRVVGIQADDDTRTLQPIEWDYINIKYLIRMLLVGV